MNDLEYDMLLFLRLAGSDTGVKSSHVPWSVLATVSNLGASISFEGNRIYVPNSCAIIERLLEICGATTDGIGDAP